MAEVDISSYPKAAPPINALDTYSQVTDIGNRLLQQKQQKLAIQQQQLDLANKHIEAMQSYLAPLIAKPDLTQKDVISSAAQLISEGRATPQEVASEFSTMPAGKDGGMPTADELRPWLQQYFIKSLDAQSRLAAVYGTPTTINTGGSTQVKSVSPVTGVRDIANIPNTLPPTATTFKNNQPTYVGGIENQAGNIAAGQSSAVSASSINGAPGTIPAGPALGAEAAANVTAHSNADQSMELQRAASTVPQQKALLGSMESKLNDFTSGPGADTWKKIASGVQRVYGGESKSVASQEDFNKMAGMIAQQQFQQLGGTGTDAKLDSAMSTSPSSFLSNRGNKEIIHLLKGNADAISVMNSEWQNSGLPPENYGKFVNQFNKSYDPRAFQLQYMTPKERTDMIKGMSKNEQSQFRNAVNVAGEKGWIPDPRSQNGQ